VKADERALHQALLNLISNAIKASPAGSKIELKAGVSEKDVRIDVVDRGCGMSREDIAKAFEAFGQAASAYIRRGEEGTGLGLNITRSLVELHGGRLLLQSRIGEGTTASICLPVARLTWFEEPTETIYELSA